MSWLTRWSLRNRSVVALAVVAILVFGAFAVVSLRQELIPSIEYPAITVFTVQPGAAPADVERGVTIPLETGLKALPGLKELDSYSNEGMSIMVALFEYGTDMESAQASAQQVVERLRPQLPTGSQPQVKALNFGDFPVLQLAVSSSLPPRELGVLLQQKLVPRLQLVPGVAEVSLSGLAGSQVDVALRPAEMARAGVTPQAVVAALGSANVSLPVGQVTSGDSSVPVRVTSTASGLAALESLPVQTGVAAVVGTRPAPSSAVLGQAASSPGSVTLGQVATLSVKPTPATSITRTNGKESVGVALTKSAGGNVVDISRQVTALLPALEKELGQGVVITTVVDQAPYITKSISSMWREGIIGAIFAVLVILFFLRSWRSTVVAGLSIPLSVIVALIILWGRGDSLNMLTLAGLTIAIGRVIDDSIVVLENAYRHLQEGDDVTEAAYKGTREVSRAVTASTLTTVAVFLPLGFVRGIASEFFRPFALTVTFALVASLLVSLTVVPVAVTWLLSKDRVGHRDREELTRLQRLYLPSLRWAIGHRAITVLAAVAVFVGAMALTPLLSTNLLDQSGETTINLAQALPPGTQIARTSEAAAGVETVLAKTSGVETYQVTIGSTGGLFGPGGGTSASSSRAQFTIDTSPQADKAVLISHLRSVFASRDDLGQITVTEGSSMGGDSSLVEVKIFADDPAVLRQANVLVVKALQGVDGLANISSNLSESMPQAAVQVDAAKAAAVGLDATQVGQYVGMVLNGMPAGTLPTDAGPLPALVTLPLGGGLTLQQLAVLPLATASGTVPLGSVAQVKQVREPVQVTHSDGERNVTVSANATGSNVGATSSQVQAALKAVQMPAGSRWAAAGASEQMGEMFSSLAAAMLAAILLVYIIMVGTFRSLLHPLILLVSIPFAAVGAVVLLLLTGTSLGMASLIGLLMLIGIVVTNAIVLLDLVEQFREAGMDARSAVVEGARRRLRPILMTAVATILALTPMALGLGEGSFLSRPLAVVVIGGLVSSTLLTLIIVPVVYLSLDRFRRRPEHPPLA